LSYRNRPDEASFGIVVRHRRSWTNAHATTYREPVTMGHPDLNRYLEPTSMTTSLPVAALVVLGTLIVILGLFAAGEISVTVVGLVAIAVGGVLDLAGRRAG
jgi:hypothetical protein